MKHLRLLIAAAALTFGVTAASAQRDVTSTYIQNSTLKDGYNTGWTSVGFHAGPTQGNNTKGYTVECWAGNDGGSPTRPVFSLLQNITLNTGSYRLVNYSFYRYSWDYNSDASISEAYLKAGTQEVKIKTLGSIEGQASYANSMAEAANRFETKMYRNVVEFDIDADNTTIEIGVYGTHTAAGSWFICGMFELFDLNDVATVSSPTDMTYAITNPGFEYLNEWGWTNTFTNSNTHGYASNNNWGNKSGVGFVEKWQSGSGHGNGGSFTQTLTNMPAGLYELSVYAQNVEQYNSNAAGSGMFLIANNDKTEITTNKQYKVRTTLAADGDLNIGINLENCTGNWIAFDRFELKFYGDPLKAYQDLLDVAVGNALDYINSNPALSSAHIAALQSIVDANDNDDNAFTEESQFNTAIETINAAVETYKAMVAPYAIFNALKGDANAIVAVAYTETTNGSHTTFAGVIDAQTTAADNAISAEAIETATNTLKAAIKTYINGAEPANDGEYFDITCLMANPDFADNTITGWTKESTLNPNTRIQCNEFYGKAAFDFYQTITGLPNGSYTLSMRAFQRPGSYDAVYADYANGINNTTAKVYVNNDASVVKNIMEEMNPTRIYTDPAGENAFNSDKQPQNAPGFVPNSMEGAAAWFAAGKYLKEVAAIVEDGSLRLGFKDEAHSSDVWTLFDEFRLHYYGSSKMIYYKQYLPQLEAEIAANYLNNALYAVLKDGQPQRAALAAANSVDASTLNTEEQLETAINNITLAREAFVAAKTAYDNLAIVLASNTYNEGDGVFQMSSSQVPTFTSAVATGTSMYTTGTAGLQDVTAQILAISNAYVLNAPDADKRYKLTLAGKGALTFMVSGTQGGYENPFMDANDNLAQHFTLTNVPSTSNPNIYTLSFVDFDGNTRYICAGEKVEAGLGNERLRTTTTAADALQIVIIATATDGVFNMYNKLTNSKMGSNGGGLYTTNDFTDWTIAEAAQASVDLSIPEDIKLATRIFPFDPTLPAGVEAYSCDGMNATGDALVLTKVTTPEANKPYILFAENGVDETLNGWGTAAAVSYTEGLLTGVYTPTAAPAGSYVLQNGDNGVGFYKVVSGSEPTVGAYRCYVTAPVASSRLGVVFDGETTTAINAINALTSGQVEIFNAAGARIPALQKGMNIIRKADGTTQKVLVK